MKTRIRTAMEDILQQNCICDYTFVQDGEKLYKKDINALDAYMMAYDMSSCGNVECYMTPDGKMACKPIFTVINGVVKLSGLII